LQRYRGSKNRAAAVLVATAHYDAETPERSFVGTIRPRIESDLGFRVAGKVAKRLVEVGQTVEIGQPLATLDEVDLKLQAEQAAAEQTAATGVLVQAAAAEQRAKDLKAKGWTTECADGFKPRRRGRSPRPLNRAERALELSKNSLSYATLVADARSVVTATLIEPGQVVAAGQASIRVARFAEKEAVVAIPETLGRTRQVGRRQRHSLVRADKKYVAKLREIAPTADPPRAPISQISLPEADDKVALGMTATLTLSDAATERAAFKGSCPLWSPMGWRLSPDLCCVSFEAAVAIDAKSLQRTSYANI